MPMFNNCRKGLYTKLDQQKDKHYEVVSINKSLSKQNFHQNF